VTCPNCRHDNRPTAKFCTRCRAKLQLICPACSAEFEPGDLFCGECGAELSVTPPTATSQPVTLAEQFASFQQALPQSFRDQLLTHGEGENRLVTVLFADMSRSVQATGNLHPEDAAALISRLLQAMVDVLVKYQGRVDRFLGDGLLAVFGAPQAHESDPERAIQAALEIREAARELGLEVTAGINTGEVYVGGIGSEQYQEVTVMGPVVNLASRLQGKAEPGQILVGEATYRHTRRAFTFTPLSLDVKGIARSVAAYAVEAALPRPEKSRGIEGLRAELIGRDEEFARLKEALTELLNGRGQIVTLIGEAGVGKSRLVGELEAFAQPSRDREGAVHSGLLPLPHGRGSENASPLWLEGRCLELGMTASYWLFIDLFRDYFAITRSAGTRPEEDERARAGRLVTCLQEFAAQGLLTEERVEEMGPLLGNLLSLRFGTDWDDRLKNAGPEQIRHQTFLALRDFFATLARRQPVVLVLEDLHWADSLSLDVISLLMETLTLVPLLLLCVYRPEREHKCWRLGSIADQKCAGRYTELSLRELTPSQSRRLVESLLTIENLPASVKELILEKSRGNPFFVEEVVHSLIDAGMVYREADAWRAREGIEAVALPESVQSVILSRVDRLERELKAVLESASVIGRIFRRRLLAYTMGEATELEQALGELEDRQLIYQERVVPEEEYSFKHVLTQETIYASLLRRRRAVFHQKVAEAMEALYHGGLDEYYEQLAYHYERSSADEKAVEYLLKAGEKARRAYLNDAAISYFLRALERLETAGIGDAHREWRLEAHKRLGQIYHGIGKVAEAEAQFRQAIALGEEMGLAPEELVRLYWWLGDSLFWQTRGTEMRSIAAEGLALLGDDTESVGAALMNLQLRRHHRNAEFVERLPYSEELRSVYDCIADAYAFDDKNLEEATWWIQALERQARQHHDLRSLGCSQLDMGSAVLGPSGDLRGAISRYQAAMDVLNKIGDKHASWCVMYSGEAYLALGDLQNAEAYARRALGILERVGIRRDIALSHTTLGTLALCRGAWEEAMEALERAAQIFHEIGWGGAWTQTTIARICLARGERQEALRRLQEALTIQYPHVRDGGAANVCGLILGGLEEAYEDPEAYRAFCRRFREEHADNDGSLFTQWYLEPGETSSKFPHQIRDEFLAPLHSEGVWQDPFGDCLFRLEKGLEIQAANGRDLWLANWSAPRLVQPLASDFAVQTVCLPASTEKPAIGGLLLWKDRQNYLRLDRGTRGPNEISFQGCLGNEDVIIGRGRLGPGPRRCPLRGQSAAPPSSERIFLRLERLGSRVNALCSADGVEWFTVGHVEFPVEDPVEVGLHAIGMIDRTIYPGAYPEGTAIRFESFHLWR
jgi:class 3 adenylate cyclase/tetratricopeptide (TPR) repeat protein